jgi:hypothetical protein
MVTTVKASKVAKVTNFTIVIKITMTTTINMVVMVHTGKILSKIYLNHGNYCNHNENEANHCNHYNHATKLAEETMVTKTKRV